MENYRSVFKSKVFELKRKLIKEYLDQCTPDQITLFNRMYGSLDKIPEDKTEHAYCQCRRTVEVVNAKKIRD